MKQTTAMLILLSCLAIFACDGYAGEKGRVRVSADQEGAYIYVNDKKKAMTGPKGEYTDILLPEGEYEFKVEKTTADGDYIYRGVKKIFVGADTSLKIEIDTKKEATPNKLKKDKANAEKAIKSMKFVLIKPGTFMMGSPSSEPNRYDNEIQHKVTISKAFHMQATEVTQAQWKAVMGSNPSKFKDCGGDCPVETVSWEDIQQFIEKLNRMSGKNYRLPTEAEWEYACRAGTTTPFNTGKCLSTDQANYDGDRPYSGCDKGKDRGKTIPVASFQPNAWGLYDMHGNVYEWCQDWYGDYSGAVTDPTGPLSGSKRVIRGGSWFDYAGYCRSAYRENRSPSYRGSESFYAVEYYLGFRLAF